MTRDAGEALELLLGGVEKAAGLGGERFVQSGEIEEIGDRFERVVDFVRDSCREAADGGELFRAEEGELSLLAVGDVEHDAAPEGVAVGDAAAGFEPAGLAVGQLDAELGVEGSAGGLRKARGLPDGGTVVGMNELEEGVEGGDVGEGTAEQFGSAMRPAESAVVDLEHPGGGVAALLRLREGVGVFAQ